MDDFLQLRQELEAANSQLQEKNSLVQQIQQMAEQQKAAQAQAQLRGEIQQNIANLLKRAGVEDDDLLAALTDTAYGRIDQTRTAYEQQMQDYYQRVTTDAQEMVWAAHKNGFASHLVGTYDLDPAFLPRLQQAKSETEMVATAEALREATQLYRQRTQSETVQAQEQARRASGVDTIAGGNSGPTLAAQLQPGREANRDVLRAILASV